jgi:hypothetical protein
MEEEVKIAHTNIQVRTTEPNVSIKPLVVVHVETIKIVVEKTNV